MRHLLFFAGVAVFIAVMFVAFANAPAGEISSPKPLLSAQPLPQEGTVCCSFALRDRERSCIAPPGQSCDVCNQVCAQE